MVTRRSFLGALAALPAITALAGSPLRLLERKPEGPEVGFATENLRFKCTERFSAGFTDWRGVYGSSGDLDEAALQRLVEGVKAMTREKGEVLAIRPTHLIRGNWYIQTGRAGCQRF